LIHAVVRVLGGTYRIRIEHGADRLEQLAAGRQPVVLSFWHENVVSVAWLIGRRLVKRGHPVTLLSSLSRDGDLGAELGRLWGAHVVRGSSSRGGTEGLRSLYRGMREGLGSPVVIPDGPRGPRRQAKPGAVVLAQLSGAPIVPFATFAERHWRLRSWDRMVVPKPFSRVRVAVGEPLVIPADLGPERIEAECRRLAATLDELGRRLERDGGEAV